MSDDDRQRWNARYAQRPPDFSPSADLVALVDHLRPQRRRPMPPFALELACGYGGNALWLAALGYAVRAVDVSDAAIAALQAEVQRRRSDGQHLVLTTTLADLDQFELQPQSLDLIVVVKFLDRRLFTPAIAALKPGGLLYWETFTLAARGPHMRPEFCLQEGELQQQCATLDILHYTENNGNGRAVCLGRRVVT